MYKLIKKRRVAASYAQAFCNIHPTLDQEVFFASLARIEAAHNHYPVFFGLLHASSIRPRDKRAALEFFAEKHTLPLPFTTLLVTLAQHKTIDLLPLTLEALAREYKKRRNITDVMITSSAPLSLEEKSKVSAFAAEKIPSHELIYSFSEDEALISGIKIQSDSYYYENSIARTLVQIENSLRYRQ